MKANQIPEQAIPKRGSFIAINPMNTPRKMVTLVNNHITIGDVFGLMMNSLNPTNMIIKATR